MVIVLSIGLLFSVNILKEKEPEISKEERIGKVMDYARDNYNIFTTYIDSADVFFDIDEQINQHEFVTTMENKLEAYDLSDTFSISIKRSNEQELRLQHAMELINLYIFDKNEYDRVNAEVNLKNKESPFIFHIAEDANISKEELEKEVLGLFQFNGAYHD